MNNRLHDVGRVERHRYFLAVHGSYFLPGQPSLRSFWGRRIGTTLVQNAFKGLCFIHRTVSSICMLLIFGYFTPELCWFSCTCAEAGCTLSNNERFLLLCERLRHYFWDECNPGFSSIRRRFYAASTCTRLHREASRLTRSDTAWCRRALLDTGLHETVRRASCFP